MDRFISPFQAKLAIVVIGMIITAGAIGFTFVNSNDNPASNIANQTASNTAAPNGVTTIDTTPRGTPSSQLEASFGGTDFDKAIVDYDQVLSGGVGKDGIPAISDPTFEPILATDISDDTQGVLVDIDGEQRFYPYNILVWHEIVNDSIGDTDFAVTFCPLCGSAVVFDRSINGQTVEFGVSGFLYESNLIMYDRTNNESLWSQSLGQGIAGVNAGVELNILPLQLLTIAEAQNAFPEATIMTTDTGFARNYENTPYGNYNENDSLLFPVSVEDNRFFAKEIFYIIPTDETSVALQVSELENGTSAQFDQPQLTATKDDNSLITVTDADGNELPGYYEMWFSWATHHQDGGTVWTP